MKITLLLLAIFISFSAGAQCTYTWERAEGDSTANIEQRTTPDYLLGPDGYKLTKRMLDSLVLVVSHQANPYYIVVRDSVRFKAHDPNTTAYIDTIRLPEVDSNGIPTFTRDFKVFHFKGKDIVHYAVKKYLVGSDSVAVHHFEYCANEWNEDLYQNRVYYTSEFGVVFETQGVAGDPMTIEYSLISNTCLSKEQIDKVQRLQGSMSAQ